MKWECFPNMDSWVTHCDPKNPLLCKNTSDKKYIFRSRLSKAPENYLTIIWCEGMRMWKETRPENRVSEIWRLLDRLWLVWLLHKENLIVWMELVCFAARRLFNIDRSVSACYGMKGRHTASTVSARVLWWLVFFNAHVSAVDIQGFGMSTQQLHIQ